MLLFVIGVLFIAKNLTSSGPNEPANNLTIDQQLKLDVNRLGLAVINFNNGNEPFEITPQAATQLRVSYLSEEFNDPRTDKPYTLTTSIPEAGELQYVIGGVCSPDDSVSQSNDDENFAIRVLLEENGTLYCIEKSEVEQIPAPPTP